MRSIKKIHKAPYAPIRDLITYSPLPSQTLDQIDPFLFLNHHGPQHYAAGNSGLPFGPHPHRGMETVTFILDGDIMHRDSGGHESVITAGGVQWMTAGRGLIHAEVSSPSFRKNGGDLEILQLWLNLPAYLKMTEPAYVGLQKEAIPTISLNDLKVTVNVISGQWDEIEGAFQSKTGVHLNIINIKKGGKLTVPVPLTHNIFFYLVRGKIMINGSEVSALHLVEFNNDAEALHISGVEDSVLLLGHALPLNEPVIARGPFVMNTEEEIRQAYADYQQGKFGRWES